MTPKRDGKLIVLLQKVVETPSHASGEEVYFSRKSHEVDVDCMEDTVLEARLYCL